MMKSVIMQAIFRRLRSGAGQATGGIMDPRYSYRSEIEKRHML